MLITPNHLRRAIALPNFDRSAAQARMAPTSRPMRLRKPPPGKPPATKAAVLVLVFPDHDNALKIILTRRQTHLRGHSGQISFPGGRCDPDDASYADTALRETCEELGICRREPIELIGTLAKVYIPPSNYDVFPHVALMPTPPQLAPNADEVAEILFLSLEQLLNPAIKNSEMREINGHSFDVPYYDVAGHKVWGATAAMLSELEGRLLQVLSDDR